MGLLAFDGVLTLEVLSGMLLLREPLVAAPARKRPLPNVRPLVRCNVARLGEALRAHGASEPPVVDVVPDPAIVRPVRPSELVGAARLGALDAVVLEIMSSPAVVRLDLPSELTVAARVGALGLESVLVPQLDLDAAGHTLLSVASDVSKAGAWGELGDDCVAVPVPVRTRSPKAGWAGGGRGRCCPRQALNPRGCERGDSMAGACGRAGANVTHIVSTTMSLRLPTSRALAVSLIYATTGA